jgi:hypothetical protein
MMNRMGLAPMHAAGAAAVVAAAALAAGCSAGTPPEDRRTPESAALRVQTVSGGERLDERTRADLEGAVGDVLSAYVVGAFLGEFPREEFVRSFESFTSEAAREAAGDIDLLTAASVPGATAVRATELDARLSFLTQGRTVHGGTATVHFAFAATMEDGSTQPLTLDGRFLLEAGPDTWSVFGYDVRFDGGDSAPVELESASVADGTS